MSGWLQLLTYEQQAQDQIEQIAGAKKMTLFDPNKGFKPNPGGQSRFFDMLPINSSQDAEARWYFLSGGIGGGKSYCGAVWLISRALMHPECRGLITANNFGQLSRSTLVVLAEVCRQYNIPIEPWRPSVEDTAIAASNLQRLYLGPNRTFIYVLSMNSFMGSAQTARGLGIRMAWCDELAYSPENAFLTLDGRLGRGPGTLKGVGVITSTPNGFNYLYDRFADPTRDESRKQIYKMVVVPTRENVANLGEDYVQSLVSNYTQELAQQELEGEFLATSTGRVYSYFSRQQNSLSGTDAEILAYDPALPLHVSLDFNRSPACAILAQVKDTELHVFHEFYLLNSDTFELAEAIAQWITSSMPERFYGREVYCYGDATGKARTANSRSSNWDIVLGTLRQHQIRPIRRYGDANPPVIERVNSVNCLCKNQRLYLDRQACPELIKDLEMLSWANDQQLDKSDMARSHLSDALGYIVNSIMPYKQISQVRMGARKLRGVAA